MEAQMSYSKPVAFLFLFLGIFSIAINLYAPSEMNDRVPANTSENSGMANDHHVPWWITY